MRDHIKFVLGKLVVYILVAFGGALGLWIYVLLQTQMNISYENINLFKPVLGVMLTMMLIFYLAAVVNHFLFQREEIVYKQELVSIKPVEPTQLEIIAAVHEAGHYVAAEHFGYTITDCNIYVNGSSGGITCYRHEGIPRPSDLKNFVIISYAGAYAEIEYFGCASNGIFGTSDSDGDIERANGYLRQYIILTEDISLTGFEEEYIKRKSIELSKQWKYEAQDIIKRNMDKIEQISEELLNKKSLMYPEE